MEMMSKELNMSTSVVVILPGIPGAHASQTALEDLDVYKRQVYAMFGVEK